MPGPGEAKAKFSRPRGRGLTQFSRAHAPHAPSYAPAPKPASDSEPTCPVSLIHFLHGFAAVAAMAQALQQARHELHHVAPMGFDVVNVCSSDPKTTLAAFPAEGFLQQLSGAAFRPVIAGIRVQVMPGSRLLAGSLGLVAWAVAFTGQHPAAWVFAFTQWFLHLLSLPKRKRATLRNRVSGAKGGSKAQTRY